MERVIAFLNGWSPHDPRAAPLVDGMSKTLCLAVAEEKAAREECARIAAELCPPHEREAVAAYLYETSRAPLRWTEEMHEVRWTQPNAPPLAVPPEVWVQLVGLHTLAPAEKPGWMRTTPRGYRALTLNAIRRGWHGNAPLAPFLVESGGLPGLPAERIVAKWLLRAQGWNTDERPVPFPQLYDVLTRFGPKHAAAMVAREVVFEDGGPRPSYLTGPRTPQFANEVRARVPSSPSLSPVRPRDSAQVVPPATFFTACGPNLMPMQELVDRVWEAERALFAISAGYARGRWRDEATPVVKFKQKGLGACVEAAPPSGRKARPLRFTVFTQPR